jgi:glyoxylase-like metal-dependent hydrolase (beta-lactamase superfamily II)
VSALADHGIVLVRAANPGPLTLAGTNSWVVGGWVVDPGPAIDAHLDALAAAVGMCEGIALTHDHEDHVEGVGGLLARVGDVAVISARAGNAHDGDVIGPLRVVALPGHSDDHLAFVAGRAAFCGDAVLGEGSVFVSGDLAGYLDGLRALRALDLAVLCPGHGDPIWDVAAKLDGYIAHRLDRERRLLAALDRGLRTEDELLDAAWDDAPPELRPFAAVTLRAHLEKLRAEGRA